MQSNIFLISILLFSLIPAFYQLRQSSLSNTTSDLINYDLSKIQDCDALSTYQTELELAISEQSNIYNLLQNANNSLLEAKTLINEIIAIENKLETSNLLMKSQNKVNKNQLKTKKKLAAKKTKNKVESNQIKLKICLSFLGDLAEVASEDCQKNIKALNEFLLVKVDVETQNAVDICNQVLVLLEKINESLRKNIEEVEGIVESLKEKSDATNVLQSTLNC